MLLRLITASVLSLMMLEGAGKPSPFPGKRPKDTVASPPLAGSDPTAMSGTATFYRFKDEAPASDTLTAAHVSLPLGSRVKVVNESNGKAITVRVTDRFSGGNGLVISVSRPAAEQLGFVRSGTAHVKLELVPDSTAR